MSAVTKHKYYDSPFKLHINIDDELTDAELASIALAKAKSSNGDHPQQFCDCVECRIRGRRFALHRPGDCTYSKLRANLVIEAESLATRIAGSRNENGTSWNRWFCEAMEELVRQHGLLNGSNGRIEATKDPTLLHVGAMSIGTNGAHDNGSNNGSASRNGSQDCELSNRQVSREAGATSTRIARFCRCGS